MRKRNLLTVLIVVAVALGGEFAWAQKSAQTAWDLNTTATSRTSQLTEPVLERIQNIETKMVAAAEDFPEDLYNAYRPKGNQDVRTAAEILLHVAALNTRQAFNLNTKKEKDVLFAAGKVPTFPLNFPYVSKQDTVTKVKESFAGCERRYRTIPIRRTSLAGYG